MKNNIKELRQRADLTQSQLAERMDVSTDQVSKLERGERRLSDFWMVKLAKVLGCTAVDLIKDNLSLDIPNEMDRNIYIKAFDILTNLIDNKKASQLTVHQQAILGWEIYTAISKKKKREDGTEISQDLIEELIDKSANPRYEPDSHASL